MKENNRQIAKKYWSKRLAKFDFESYLDETVNNDNDEESIFKSEMLNLSSETKTLLDNVAKSEKAKHIILLTVLGILLQKVSGKKESLIFTPLYADKSNNVFSNAIPIRIPSILELTFSELVMQLKDYLVNDFSYGNYPIDENLLNISNISTIGLSVKEIQSEQYGKVLNPDIQFVFSLKESLSLEIKSNQHIYTLNFIKNLAKTYVNLLEKLLNNRVTQLKEIDLISESEKDEIVNAFNSTKLEYNSDSNLVELFEEQVQLFPNSKAVVAAGKHVSYLELNSRANQVAQFIEKQDCKSNLVGLMLDRSIDMIVGILGVLKSGKAYLPIAGDLPKDRIDFMLRTSESRLVLTQEQFLSQTNDKEYQMVDINGIAITSEEKGNITKSINPNDLAYCIFTSGSTGNPKGVLMEHRSVVNLVTGLKEIVYKNNKDLGLHVGLLASYTFDCSIKQIFSSLLLGHVLHISSEAERSSGKKLKNFYQENKIEISDGTPTHLRLLLGDLEGNVTLNDFKAWLIGGEVLPKDLVKLFYNKFKEPVQLFNVYGPTETCVNVTCYPINRKLLDYDFIPIGFPLPNSRIYITDSYGHLMPKGMTGELCIAGDGLARGYIGEKELTASKFRKKWIKEEDIVYNTGDLARWLPDGNIEFRGRKDSQIKLRGYRIELEEIENCLSEHPEIKEVVVGVKKFKEEMCLVAYFIADKKLKTKELRSFLKEKLPEYMIPSFFMSLGEFPLTISGKLNKRMLPDPEIKVEEDILKPSNETEEKLLLIWSTLLNLNKDQICITSNFLGLGGNSLKSVFLSNKINKEFKIAIDLNRIIELQSIQNLAAEINSLEASDYVEIKKSKIKEYYPLSSAQKRLYFLNEYNKNSVTYNIPQFFVLDGDLDIKRLKKSFESLIKRHESLRTRIEILDDKLIQKIVSTVDFDFEYYEAEEKFINTTIAKIIRPFDLTTAPMLRVGLIKVSSTKHILVVDVHHIISDGVSHSILMKEFVALYNNKELLLPSLQYRDYVEWQISNENQSRINKQKLFWLNEFSEKTTALELPTDYHRPQVSPKNGKSLKFLWDKDIVDKLEVFAQQEQVTMFSVLLTTFLVFINKLSGQKDIVIGTSVAGRPHSDLESMIGIFINTLALRHNVTGTKSFRDFLKEVNDKNFLAIENQDYSYEELVDELNLDRDTSRNPLFDVMFEYQNIEGPELKLSGLELSPYKYTQSLSKFDLTFRAYQSKEGLQLSFDYSTDLFKQETIERFAELFKHLVREITNNIDTKVSQFNMLHSNEEKRMLESFNQTKLKSNIDSNLIELFENQVHSSPNEVALVFGENTLTYDELNTRANQLGRYLQNKGVVKGDNVAILIERSIDMIVSMLGILKVGAHYLPITTDLPEARVKFMLKNCNTSFLITQKKYLNKVTFSGQEVDIKDSEIHQRKGTNISVDIDSKDLAYCIYTSGSTGTPKGVLIEHRSVVNLVKGLKEKIYKPLSGDKLKVALLASYAFDASVQQIFGCLLQGHTLCIANDEERSNGKELLSFFNKNQINVSDGTPTHFRLLNNILNADSEIENLKIWVLAGEELPKNLVQSFYEKFKGDLKLYNMYGPTETSVDSTYYEINRSNLDDYPFIPIGSPLPNERVYITDDNGIILPIGIIGEICIAGDGLARGYLGEKELTASKFRKNWIKEEGVVYKTGDLGRWLSSGNIEYKGRIDNQIKLRGYRIELGEVETCMMNYPAMKEAIIDYREYKEEPCLVGYYESEKDIVIADLRTYMAKSLPKYMIPAYFVFLKSIPQNSSGKINKKELPDPEVMIENDSLKPTTKIEKELMQIWSEILSLEKNQIGLKTNFLEIGGNSLKLIFLSNSIKKKFNVSVSLVGLIELENIYEISKEIDSKADQNQIVIKKAALSDYYPVSSAQKRMYFLHEYDENSVAYNIPQFVVLKGELDVFRLQSSFSAILSRHEVLRTVIDFVEGAPMQRIVSEMKFKIDYYESDDKSVDELVKEFIRPFDLSSAPFLRVGLIKVSSFEHILIVDMHHIISDGLTQSILIEEFVTLYDGGELSELDLQYKDYAVWQQSEEYLNQITSQKSYWLKEFEEVPTVLSLPTDYVRPQIRLKQGNSLNFTLDEVLVKKLEAITQEEQVTMFSLLQSVFLVLLNKLSNQENIVVGTSVAGRSHSSLESMVGVFINSLALRNKVEGSKKFRSFVQEVNKKTIEGIDNQEYGYEDLVDSLRVDRDSSRNPLFDVMFEYQSLERPELKLSGIDISPYAYSQPISKLDITFRASKREDGIFLCFDYAIDLFKQETIARFVTYFKLIIEQITESNTVKISELDILLPEEEDKLHQFNRSALGYPLNSNLVTLFENEVEKNPDRIAVVSEGEELTYAELHQKTNQLARHLFKENGKGLLIGLLVDRSIDMLVGILGILKSGNSYLPISYDQPDTRVKHMLHDNVEILLTQDKFLNRASKFLDKVIDINSKEILKQSTSNLSITINSSDLAYCIFTSGSTGTPKGVLIEHKNVINLVLGIKEKVYKGLGSGLRVGLLASHVFDASVQQIFGSLLLGNTLFIASEEERSSGEGLISFYQKNRIEISDGTPTHFRLVFREISSETIFKNLKVWILAGEVLSKDIVSAFYARFNSGITLFNMYGPTETCVDSTFYKIDREYLDSFNTIPIGSPLPNERIYITDDQGKLVPLGVAGELCIAGDGLARGYLKDDLLTKRKFKINWIEGESRIYRTGDLARWNSDGKIEFLGRKDNQIKLRGYRIEPGEIEKILNTHLLIKEVVVDFRKFKEEFCLVAYYVSQEQITTSKLIAFLKSRLPDYMIPSHFIILENLPLTTSGKLDKTKLPNPEINLGEVFTAPRNETEGKLQKIWAEVLKLDKDSISINTRFLELGGHSLNAIQIANNIKKIFQIEIKLVELFKNQTIAQQSSVVDINRWINDEKVEEDIERQEIDI